MDVHRTIFFEKLCNSTKNSSGDNEHRAINTDLSWKKIKFLTRVRKATGPNQKYFECMLGNEHQFWFDFKKNVARKKDVPNNEKDNLQVNSYKNDTLIMDISVYHDNEHLIK